MKYSFVSDVPFILISIIHFENTKSSMAETDRIFTGIKMPFYVFIESSKYLSRLVRSDIQEMYEIRCTVQKSTRWILKRHTH